MRCRRTLNDVRLGRNDKGDLVVMAIISIEIPLADLTKETIEKLEHPTTRGNDGQG